MKKDNLERLLLLIEEIDNLNNALQPTSYDSICVSKIKDCLRCVSQIIEQIYLKEQE